MGQATEIYSKEFDQIFSGLPQTIRSRIIEKLRFLGRQLDSFPHERLQGRPEFRIRIGDYRLIYRFDLERNQLYMVTLGHRRDVYRF
jgi:mRNA interferase RelE/StbE